MDFPRRKNLRGLGLTDWEGYSSALAKKFDYMNTYFDREPRLDISAIDISPERRAAYDFIISSEVFEHVVPRVDVAFERLRNAETRLVFVLTVPYGLQLATIEHFPELHQFSVVEQNGGYQLDNVTKTGVSQVFTQLVFHWCK